MYNKFIGSSKDVFKTKAFRLSILLPVFTALIIGILIHFNQPFSDFLSYLWKQMKLPLAISSLAIPFATWTIANHRSSQMIKTMNSQEDKRLYESYFEQEAFFERVFGRCIVNSKWKYIVSEDLPVIHSRIYEFNKLKNKKEIVINSEVEGLVDSYFAETKKVFWEFYPIFIDELSKDDSNDYQLNHLVNKLFTALHHHLMTATIFLGTRYIDKNEISLPMLCIAYFEINHLMTHFDVKVHVSPEDFSDDSDTFNAVIRVVSDYYKLEDEKLNLHNIEDSIYHNMMVKHAVKSPLVYAVDSMMNKISESYIQLFDELKVHPKSGDFLSITLFSGDDIQNAIDISFTISECKDDHVGQIIAVFKENSVSIDIYESGNAHRMGIDEQAGKTFFEAVGGLIFDYLEEKVFSKDVI